MKTEFKLQWASGHDSQYKVEIIGEKPESNPYVSVNTFSEGNPLFIADKDLERFAVNILKALKSKKLTYQPLTVKTIQQRRREGKRSKHYKN